MTAEILPRAASLLAEGNEQVAGTVEHQPRTEMMTAVGVLVLGEDHLQLIDALRRQVEMRAPPRCGRRRG